ELGICSQTLPWNVFNWDNHFFKAEIAPAFPAHRPSMAIAGNCSCVSGIPAIHGHKGQDMNWSIRISLLALLVALSGCASMLGPPSSTKHAGSVVDYLYPDAKTAPQLQSEVTHLHPPVRVGVAF